MIKVVLEEVVFRQVGEIAMLYGGQERDVRGVGGERDNVHHCKGGGSDEWALEKSVWRPPDLGITSRFLY